MKITTDYDRYNIDITCPCGGDPNCNNRCMVCKVCKRLIKGMWWIEHLYGGCSE